jgi:Fe-Mn family superoxide dismutase
MGPGGGEPAGTLAKAIAGAFGGLAGLKEKLSAAAMGQFGSGWGWLVVSGKNLEIIARPNQDSPLMEGKVPILGVDVWEHAYYLKYQNRRADYLTAWWNTVRWDAVAARFTAAAGGSRRLRSRIPSPAWHGWPGAGPFFGFLNVRI